MPGRHSIGMPRIIRLPDGPREKSTDTPSTASATTTVDRAGGAMDGWKPEEREMRAREVRATAYGTWFQAAIVVAALLTARAALSAASEAAQEARHNLTNPTLPFAYQEQLLPFPLIDLLDAGLRVGVSRRQLPVQVVIRKAHPFLGMPPKGLQPGDSVP
jgi:hypothetical protein